MVDLFVYRNCKHDVKEKRFLRNVMFRENLDDSGEVKSDYVA